MRPATGPLLYICLSLTLVAACENARFQPAVNNVNNQTGNLTLRFESPASGEIALLASARAVVDLSVTDAFGGPAPGARLSFRLVGAAGGATLSATGATSDDAGHASMQIVAGASAAHFEVRVEHERAVPLVLDVTVSASGLVRFRVAFTYDGARLPEDLAGLQTGIVFGSGCDGILPYTAALDRARNLPSWYTLVEYPELPVDLPFAIVARAFDDAGEPRLGGCLDPAPGTLIPGATVDVDLILGDYARRLAGPWSFLATPEADGLPGRARELFSGWSELGRCGFGLAQRTLDCLVAHLEGGDLSTCAGGVPTDDSTWIRERRGVADAQGCRNGLDAQGRTSLESRLQETLQWNDLQDHLERFELALSSEDPADLRLAGRLVPGEAAPVLELDSLKWRVDGQWLTRTVAAATGHGLACPWSGERCEPEPFFLTLDWQNHLIAHLRAVFMEPSGLPLEGAEFSARLLEDAAALAWPGTLAQRLTEALGVTLPEETWSRALELVGWRLVNPSQPTGIPDCRVSGSLWIPDRDLDSWIDTVVPDLIFTPCVPPCE